MLGSPSHKFMVPFMAIVTKRDKIGHKFLTHPVICSVMNFYSVRRIA
jgi:hypothetical protein